MSEFLDFYRTDEEGRETEEVLQSPYYRMIWRQGEPLPYSLSFPAEDDYSDSGIFFRVNVGGVPLGRARSLKEQNLGSVNDYLRRIESGSLCERFDFVAVDAEGVKQARVEYAARKDRLKIAVELFSEKAIRTDLCFEIKCTDCRIRDGIASLKFGEEAITVVAEDCLIEKTVDGVGFYWKELTVPADRFYGKSVALIFSERQEGGSVKVELFEPIRSERPVRYIADEDLYEADMRCGMAALNGDICGESPFPIPGKATPSPFESDTVRKTLDRAKVSLTNDSDVPRRFVLRFSVRDSEKGDFRNVVFGFCPMLRDENGEPTGIPVQVSKSWNYFGEMPENVVPDRAPNDPVRLYEGVWYNGYAEIPVEPHATRILEYTVAYAEWGGVPPVSHAQLCICGWGGCQLWEENSMVPWTESLCIDPGIGLERSFIDDIRPIYCFSEGVTEKYGGTENMGGADCLVLERDGKNVPLTRMKSRYASQGPNLVVSGYDAMSADGSVGVEYRFRMGRTDDIVRAWIECIYSVRKETDFSRFTLFQMCADNYADHTFRSFAYGTGEKIVLSERYSENAKSEQFECGADDWFLLYDGEKERASDMFVLREYEAIIGGRKSGRAFVRRKTTVNYGLIQPAWELYLPTDERFHIGDRVRLVVELMCLPMPGYYYGKSDYLADKLCMPYGALFQSHVGKLYPEVRCGRLLSVYPLRIETLDGKAEFMLSGGLGYVPVSFTIPGSYANRKLYRYEDGKWVDTDRYSDGVGSTQCHMEDGGYVVTFNINNSPEGKRVLNRYLFAEKAD